jgi:hypothetical protein
MRCITTFIFGLALLVNGCAGMSISQLELDQLGSRRTTFAEGRCPFSEISKSTRDERTICIQKAFADFDSTDEEAKRVYANLPVLERNKKFVEIKCAEHLKTGIKMKQRLICEKAADDEFKATDPESIRKGNRGVFDHGGRLR